ncbi:MAG: TolC family protein [Acidobacteria bacterium]|nr:TolC family protein [Acidobacteriota bacterium]
MITVFQLTYRASQYCLGVALLLAFAANGSAQELAPSASTEASERASKDNPADGTELGALTLPDALSLALRESPILAAFTWDIRAADAMVQQAGLRPNPELSVVIEEVRWTSGPSEKTRSTTISGALEPGTLTIPGMNGQPSIDLPVIRANPASGWEWEKVQGARSGFSESELTISIAQPIQLGKKRAKRVAVAEREKELVLWDYQAARADVLAQTASDFVEVLAAQEHVALDRELVELAEEIVRTFSLRVKAGQVSPLELSRAEVALATTRATLEESLTGLEAARAVLASNWGSKRATFARAVGRLDETSPVPGIEELEARVNRNPDMARWSSELAARRADFTLERAQRIPDLTVELGFRSAGLADRKATQYGFGSAGDFGFTRSETGYSADRDNSLVC